MAATPAQRDAAQRLYEVDGYSYTKLSEAVGVSTTTLQKWRKKYNWAPKGSKRPAPPEGTVQHSDGIPVVMPGSDSSGLDTDSATTTTGGGGIYVGPPPTTTTGGDVDLTAEPPTNIDALEAEVAALRRQLDASNALVAELKPEVEVPILTEDNIDELVPEAELRQEALAELLHLERAAIRGQGVPPVERGSKLWDAEVERIMAEKRLERLTNPTAHVPLDMSRMVATRTVKMVHPSGSEVQHVYEPHSNTRTGDLREMMHYMRDKGHRLSIPQKCLLFDCSAPAATVGGEFSNWGFCHGRGHDLPFRPEGSVLTGQAQSGRLEPAPGDTLVGSTHRGAVPG